MASWGSRKAAFVLASALGVTSMPAMAQDNDVGADSPACRIQDADLTLKSYHAYSRIYKDVDGRERHFNEINPGLAVSVHCDWMPRNGAAMGLAINNSYGKLALAAGYTHKVFSSRPVDISAMIGAAFTGYEENTGMAVLPFLGVSFNLKALGFTVNDTRITPNIDLLAPGVVALKMRAQFR